MPYSGSLTPLWPVGSWFSAIFALTGLFSALNVFWTVQNLKTGAVSLGHVSARGRRGRKRKRCGLPLRGDPKGSAEFRAGREHRLISHFALPDEAPCPLRERGSRGCGRCDRWRRTILAREWASKCTRPFPPPGTARHIPVRRGLSAREREGAFPSPFP